MSENENTVHFSIESISRHATKNNFGHKGKVDANGEPSDELMRSIGKLEYPGLNTGALLRIADAIEAIAAPILDARKEVMQWRKSSNDYRELYYDQCCKHRATKQTLKRLRERNKVKKAGSNSL